ncbi:MAG: N-acetylmuramoyl-L-alanine amidase family protein [Candidatus Dormibacteria bacterium]|jgi:N-acetylmuramoyl-L-alanine amidase
MRTGPIRPLHVVALALGVGLLAALLPGTVLASKHAPTTKIPQRAPRPYVVAIDPGHGGYDPGAISPYNGLEEKNVTLSVGLDLRRLLQAQGVRVVMSRTRDVFVSIPQAEAVAEKNRANVFVSLWVNDWTTQTLEGVTVFTPHSWDTSFADAVDSAMGKTIASFGMGNRGVQPLPRLWVHATMPTLTIESGFMSNAKDSALLAQPGFRQALAQGIANGILAYAPQIPKLHAEELAYQVARAKSLAAGRAAASQSHFRSTVVSWIMVAILTTVLLFLALYRDTLGRSLRFVYHGFMARAPRAARAGFFGFQRAVTPRERKPRHTNRSRPTTRSRPTASRGRTPAMTASTRSARGKRPARNDWRLEGPATRPQRVSEMVHPDERHRMLRGHRSIYDDLSL